MELQLLVLYIALGVCSPSNSSATEFEQPVYFSLVVSSTPAFNTLEVIPAVNRTLELIRRNVTPPGYYLQYSQVLDVQVSSIS